MSEIEDTLVGRNARDRHLITGDIVGLIIIWAAVLGVCVSVGYWDFTRVTITYDAWQKGTVTLLVSSVGFFAGAWLSRTVIRGW